MYAKNVIFRSYDDKKNLSEICCLHMGIQQNEKKLAQCLSNYVCLAKKHSDIRFEPQ